jgi:hypothetical protein
MSLVLARVPDTPDFEGAKGKSVTIAMNDHVGTVLIAKAEYAGVQLVPDGLAVSKLTFPVAPDRNTLKMVFVFTASTAGRGELREDAGADSQFLREVRGDEPFQAMRIFGK